MTDSADVTADRDTLFDELATVTDRHTGAMTPDDIVLALFEFTESYRFDHDVEVALTTTTQPPDDAAGDEPVDMIRVLGATDYPPLTPINDHTGAFRGHDD